MVKMTGGQALMQTLYQEGVRVIFGLPGVQLYHALDALYELPDIKLITTRHEQATTYMADGYSRTSDSIGVSLMVPGPGLLNATAGISTAFSASSPILVVSGQIERDLIGSDRGILHEVNDQIDSIRPITKWAHRSLDPVEIPGAVHEAFHQLKTGRPRPVEIEVPPETLAEVAEIDLGEPGSFPAEEPDVNDIKRAASMISAASNPLIWVGGGVNASGANEALLKLAEHIQAPVIATAEGRGSISDRHPMSLEGLRLRNDPIAKDDPKFDLIISVGTRMAFPTYLDGQQVIQIDVDPTELGRNYDNTFGIQSDARRGMEELYKEIVALMPAKPSREQEVAEVRNRRYETALRVEPQDSYIKAIRAAIPDDGILISGMTQMGYYSRTFYPVYEPKTFITSSYSGNLGYAFPTAIGAKVANPEKAVVALSGDGGFLFNSQELATAVQHGINVVVVLFNDNAYGNVLRDQVTRFNGRAIGAELKNPDFMKLAEAYGARGVRVQGPERLEAAIREALAIDAPSLIEVPVEMMPTPFE